MRHKLSVKRKLIPEDEEKPFLEHLEDLRRTLMRILSTLIVTMVICFMFNDQIFKLIQYPIHKAEIGVPEKEQSPSGLKDPHEWLQVASVAHALIGKSEAQRALILDHAFQGPRAHLRPVLEALLIRHAALDLPAEAQDAYIQAAAGGDQKLIAMVQDMAAKKADVSFEKGPKQMRMWLSKPGEGFNLSMKLALYAGVVVGFPLLLYFLLEFIVPGLRPEERRVLWPSMAVGFGLFLLGVGFAYYLVTPQALRFLYLYDLSIGGVADYRMTDYVSFVVQFTLIFGLCFELPVIVYALNKLGILSYELMKRTRSYAVIIIVIIAALLTPTTDLVNLSLLAVPMVFLYEVSIWIAYFHDRAVKKRETAEQAAEQAAREARRERAAMAGAYLEESAGVTPAAATQEAGDPFHRDPTPFPHDHEAHDPHGLYSDGHDDGLASHPHDSHHHGHDGPEFAPDATADTPSPIEETKLTGPPAGEAESYRDRAVSESAAPADGPTPPTEVAPGDTPSAGHTPGEPSEESRRHSD